MVVLPARVMVEMSSGSHPRAPDDLAQDRVDGADHHLLDAVQAARLFGIDDARDHVLAVADLAVELSVLGHAPPR